MSLQSISESYRLLFLPLAVIHLLLFLQLNAERNTRLVALRSFIRNLARRVVAQWSDERPDSTIDEELDVLLHDLRDALPRHAWEPDKITRVREAVFSADATREYLYGMNFEKRLSLARAITETYPLLGIVGTVLAIAAGLAPAEVRPVPRTPPAIESRASPAPLQSQDLASPRPATAPETGEDNDLRNVTQNFGHSVWTTLYGLSLAIFFLLINAWLEPEFNRLVEYRTAIRDIIRQVKSRLDVSVHPHEPPENRPGTSYPLRAP